MVSLNDPDPYGTPGLEPGTGVPPGETPPGEASATEGLASRQTPPPTGPSPWLIAFGIAFAVGMVLIVVGLVGRAISLF